MSGAKPAAGKTSIVQRLSNIMGGAFSSKKAGVAGKDGGKGGKTPNRDSAPTRAPATSSRKVNRRLSTATDTAHNNKSKADSGLTTDNGNNAYLRFHAISSAGYEADI